jgi:hypothetical protein
VKRKNPKPREPQAKVRAPQEPDTGWASVLPMEIQIGDRITDHDFEWEVLTHPAVLHGAKSLRARVQRPGLPESEREMTWPAHVRVKIRRGPSHT